MLAAARQQAQTQVHAELAAQQAQQISSLRASSRRDIQQPSTDENVDVNVQAACQPAVAGLLQEISSLVTAQHKALQKRRTCLLQMQASWHVSIFGIGLQVSLMLNQARFSQYTPGCSKPVLT